MAHSLSPVTVKDVPLIVESKPLEVPWLTKFVLYALIIVGALAFIQGLYTGDPVHAWTAFQVNFTYWFCIAAASTCFSAVIQICNAQWARPVRRIFEASSYFFFYSLIPLVVLYFGRDYLFQWAHHEILGKGVWLNPNFVYARDFLAILAFAYLSSRVVFFSVQRDIGAIRGGLTGVDQDKASHWYSKRYDRFVRGWSQDTIAEIEKVSEKMARFSPGIIAAYALVMSLIAFDQIMSVDPHWFSTLFGALFFMSGAYLAIAWCAIGVHVLRKLHPLFLAKIERRTLHDLGKLLFGFGIFWAYMFWSHYLTIWYGNLPEETGWLILRLRDPIWHGVAWTVLGACFIVPFILGLSRDVKQVPALLAGTALIVACGIWLQQYLLFAPTLFPDHVPINFSDILISLGFFGAFALSAFSFLERVPLIPFGDFYRK